MFLFIIFVHFHSAVLGGNSDIDQFESFHNFKVLRVKHPVNDYHIYDHSVSFYELFILWLRNKDKMEILHEENEGFDMLVSPGFYEGYVTYMTAMGAKVTVLNEDIGGEIVKSETCQVRYKRNAIVVHNFRSFFNCYQKLADHHYFMENLAKAHPNKARTFNIGKSYKGKNITVIQISHNVDTSGHKPIIWIDGGMHGREWVSVTTPQWIAATLLGEVDTTLSGELDELLDTYQFMILPISNPDGFEYSSNSNKLKKNARFWRKTRSDTGHKSCKGVDPNRNFDVNFGEHGVSTDKCDETYPGNQAFTEKNTIAMRDFLTLNMAKIKLYISYHSYGQLLLKPFLYKNTRPSNAQIHDAASDAYVKALFKKHGEVYRPIQGYELYRVSGASSSWMYKMGVVNSYTVEQRDKGVKGFVLPPDQIVPIGEENVRGLIALVKQLRY